MLGKDVNAVGALSDRIGRRPIIILAAFGAAPGYLLFGIGCPRACPPASAPAR